MPKNEIRELLVIIVEGKSNKFDDKQYFKI